MNYKIISIHSLIRGRTLILRPHSLPFFKFQSTPSYEGEPLSDHSSAFSLSDFNPLPHTRENTRHLHLPQVSLNFNPLPHTRENRLRQGSIVKVFHFNPLPHTRENVATNKIKIRTTAFQSTPSYEGEHLDFRMLH